MRPAALEGGDDLVLAIALTRPAQSVEIGFEQQIAVFCATVVVIFGLLGAGIWLIAQRLTAEANLQTALLMARQVEIALADSLRERPVIVQRQQQAQKGPSSFWRFLGNVFDGRRSAPSSTTTTTRYSAPRHDEVRGLMRAFSLRCAGMISWLRDV